MSPMRSLVAPERGALLQWQFAGDQRVEERNGELHGNTEGVAGDFGLSDLQDAGCAYAGQFGVDVLDVPEGLSGAG
jgi:hypothetical protein